MPDGVFNVVQGEGETGAILARHPGCSKLSFTGSVPTGVKIMQAGKKTGQYLACMKRRHSPLCTTYAGAVGIRAVTLELGGKSPMIVFPDADLGNAVRGALMANFLSQGQVCSNGTRVFVHRDVFREFVFEFCRHAARMKVGDPLEENTTVGAAITEEHGEKVRGKIWGS